MTITDIKKQNFKTAIRVLIRDFNAHNFDDEMGGRKIFWIPNEKGEDIMGEITRDSDVYLDSDQARLEKKINRAICDMLTIEARTLK